MRPISTKHSIESPAFLRVDEAAALLRVSRSKAYELVNVWLAADGEQGIPCIRLGRRILVARAPLDEWAQVGCGVSEPIPPSFT